MRRKFLHHTLLQDTGISKYSQVLPMHPLQTVRNLSSRKGASFVLFCFHLSFTSDLLLLQIRLSLSHAQGLYALALINPAILDLSFAVLIHLSQSHLLSSVESSVFLRCIQYNHIALSNKILYNEIYLKMKGIYI